MSSQLSWSFTNPNEGTEQDPIEVHSDSEDGSKDTEGDMNEDAEASSKDSLEDDAEDDAEDISAEAADEDVVQDYFQAEVVRRLRPWVTRFSTGQEDLSTPWDPQFWPREFEPEVDAEDYMIILGSGGSGTVLAARTTNGQACAVKGITTWARPTTTEEQEQLLVRTAQDLWYIRHEIRTLANLGHENVIKLLGVITYQNIATGFITERIETLDSLYDNKRISEYVLFDMFQHLTVGLAYIHSLGIVHGDIKSDNVGFIAAEEDWLLPKQSFPHRTWKLLDFGCANPSGGPGRGCDLYHAPEARAGKAGRSSDLFSLAIMVAQELEVPGVVAGQAAAPENFDQASGQVEYERYLVAVRAAFARNLRTSMLAGLLRQEPTERPTAEELKGILQGYVAFGVPRHAKRSHELAFGKVPIKNSIIKK